MSSFLVDEYKKISAATYHPFEIHHVYGANHLLDNSLSIRDLQMLTSIATSQTQITPSLLSGYFSIANNALSNRLSYFESKNYVSRSRSSEDSRQVYITILPEGEKVVAVYTEYINSFIKRIRQKMSFMDVGTFYTTFKKLQQLLLGSSVDSEENPTTKMSPDLLMKINKYFSAFDIQLIESRGLKLKINDVFVLTEYYIMQQQGAVNLKKLSDFLMIPYQTLVSKLAKIADDGYLTKDDKAHYQLTLQAQSIVEAFAYQRIAVYYKTMSIFTDKERELIIKMFAELTSHSLNYQLNL